jgi:hypothetical protein
VVTDWAQKRTTLVRPDLFDVLGLVDSPQTMFEIQGAVYRDARADLNDHSIDQAAYDRRVLLNVIAALVSQRVHRLPHPDDGEQCCGAGSNPSHTVEQHWEAIEG